MTLKNTRIIKFLIVLLTIQLSSLCAHEILVFSNNHGKGNSTELDISNCTNLPDDMVERVSSVDTKNECAQFYSGEDCTGDSIEMMARSPSHGALYNLDFNNKMVSAGPCRDECSLNVTGPLPPAEGVNLTIYGEKEFRGPAQTITIKGCTPVPRKFNYRVLSVNTTDNENCFQLYNNLECHMSGWRENELPYYDSIELRHGTPFHDDLSRWAMHQVKAISHCSYKCTKYDFSGEGSDDEPKEKEAPGENLIRLYDEYNYHGDSIELEIQPNSCVNLADFAGWEGAPESFQVYESICEARSGNSSCFKFFTEENCSGENFRKVHFSVNYMGSFAERTRSIFNCNQNSVKLQYTSQNVGVTVAVAASICVVLIVSILVAGIFIFKNKTLKNTISGLFTRNDGTSLWNRME